MKSRPIASSRTDGRRYLTVARCELNGPRARGNKLKVSPTLLLYLVLDITLAFHLQVVFVATEVHPWSKHGGLADVMSSLPSALAARGHEVMTVSPMFLLHSSIPPDLRHSGLYAPVQLATRPSNPSQDTGHDRRRSGSQASTSGRSSSQMDQRSLETRLESFKARRRLHKKQMEAARRPFSIHFSSSSSSSSSSSTSSSSRTHGGLHSIVGMVGFYSIQRDGVNHVFVDHEMFQSHHDPGRDIGHPSMMTYTDGKDKQDIDIQERCSVLCQAALAAPIAMWQPSSLEPDLWLEGDERERWREATASDPFTLQLIHGLGRTEIDLKGKRMTALEAAIARLESQSQSMDQGGSGDHRRAYRPHDESHSSSLEEDLSASPVIFVANDWPTGLLPIWLDTYKQRKKKRKERGKKQLMSDNGNGKGKVIHESSLFRFQTLVASHLSNSRFAFAIHNFGFHGQFSPATFKHLGLSSTYKSLFSTHASSSHPGCPPLDPFNPLIPSVNRRASIPSPAPGSGNKISWIQAALLSCDISLTVSPRHAMELRQAAIEALTSPSSPSSSSSPRLIINSRLSSSRLATGGPPQGPKLASALLQPGRSLLRRSREDQEERNHAIGLIGILNGIDASGAWNPFTDPLLPPHLRFVEEAGGGLDSILAAKDRAKRLLQSRLGLKVDPSVPLFSFIGRLEDQKGVDVLLSSLISTLGSPLPLTTSDVDKLQVNDEEEDEDEPSSGSEDNVLEKSKGKLSSSMASSFLSLAEGRRRLADATRSTSPPPPLQIVVLGEGQLWMEKAVSLLPSLYPGMAAGVAGINDEQLAHVILAASDFVVMPSRYEPCGLVAMCGQRYGAVPIVSPVGGLVDIVCGRGEEAEEAESRAGYLMRERLGAVGDSMGNRVAAADLTRTMLLAACDYRMMNDDFLAKRKRCIERDSSWDKAACEWEEALLGLLVE